MSGAILTTLRRLYLSPCRRRVVLNNSADNASREIQE